MSARLRLDLIVRRYPKPGSIRYVAKEPGHLSATWSVAVVNTCGRRYPPASDVHHDCDGQTAPITLAEVLHRRPELADLTAITEVRALEVSCA